MSLKIDQFTHFMNKTMKNRKLQQGEGETAKLLLTKAGNCVSNCLSNI